MAQRPIHEIEAKWQEYWEKNGTYRAQDPVEHPKGAKYYGLIEFPYPSGEGLHVGHPRPYTAIDILTRKRRMEGYNVLYPIGWDAFGLPTENFAIKHKVKPADATKKNVANITRQIKSLGIGFDWTREINTTDPAYYKWTQWQFLQFVKAGLAYKALTTINWCPNCKIGLANEEAQGGVCERCGTPVEKREKAQWMIKITKYAERLLKDLDTVDYLEKIKKQQIDWIGKSEGAEVTFRVPKFEKVLVATNNKSKLTRLKRLLGAVLPSIQLVSPSDLGLEEREIQEGDDLTANAWAKAQSYRDQTDLPIIGTDTGLFIAGESLNASMPKRNALGGQDESSMTQEEKADAMDAFYRSIAEKHGGEVEAYWKDVTLLLMPDGKERSLEDMRPITLIDKRKGEMDPYFPIRGLYKSKATGKYAVDQNEEEEIFQEMGPILHVLNALLSEEVRVFTTRIDTIFSGTFLILAPEHPLVKRMTTSDYRADVEAYVQKTRRKTDMERMDATKEKTGAFTGSCAINPATGDRMPIWISDFVLAGYGTGAVFADAHDERDFEMAKKYHLPLKVSIRPPDEELWKKVEALEACYEGDGTLVHSGSFDGLSSTEARVRIVEWLERRGTARKRVNYKLRDWVFSRQRYWGEPIPLVYCQSCAKKKQKALLIHGLGSNANEHWFPRMKEELEKNGFDVFAPTMSTSDHPTIESWIEELKPFAEQLGEDGVIVAHSLGGTIALHLIERLGKKIGHVFLVSPLVGPVTEEEWQAKKRRPTKKDYDAARAIWEMPVDWQKIASLVGTGQIISSDDDVLVPHASHSFIPKGWYINQMSAKGHFNDPESPELMDAVLASKLTGWIPVPDAQLPLTLPEVDAYEPTDTGESPLAKIRNWVETTCPKCGGSAERETDTMPNWAGSSWYFLRYCDPQNQEAFASEKALKYWMPVDLYNGGMEHTTLHLLYSRFWHKFLWDMGYIPTECGSEPYRVRRSHNMILGEGGVKMSKSKGNVINPDDVVKDYGADVFRVYEMFIGPYDQPAPWDTNGIEGVRRFLDKVWNLFDVPVRGEWHSSTSVSADIDTLYHQTVKKVTDGIENLQFNTCISQMMILTNVFQDVGGVPEEYREGFLKILAPYAPHLTEELWHQRGHKESVHHSSWPAYDPTKLKSSTFEMPVQINGKIRDVLIVDADISDEEAKTLALASEKVQKWLEGKEPQKATYIKGRLVSIVI